MKQTVELNEQFRRALELLEQTNKCVFITGKAGTGKSTLLTYWREKTKKKIVVLAPTGVAALNVRGQTIHSFFRFRPDITVETVKKLSSTSERSALYKNLDAIVIDEISMVRADLLDCVDRFLRLNGKMKLEPFGGVQMVFIGDLYQLPPVVAGKERAAFQGEYQSQYFFDAKVFSGFSMEYIELEKIYRQSDQTFIGLLNAVRNNSATDEHLTAINARLNPDFEPRAEDFFIHLTTTNQLADEVNQRQLSKLPGKPRAYTASLTGDFNEKTLPTAHELRVKAGSQVMMLNNDSHKRWVNGSIGRIVKITPGENDGEDEILVELPSGSQVEVTPHTWELFEFSYNQSSGGLVSETVGTFTQYPLCLAWAVTIHKSQGKTFDRMIVDIGRGTFAHGQLYVALSRCTSLEGLYLKKPILKRHILMDWRVVKFVTRYQYQISEKALSLDGKIALLKGIIKRKGSLKILYLKSNDEKSSRVIKPRRVGEMEYLDKSFIGVEGFDSKRQETRVFRVDRILEMREEV